MSTCSRVRSHASKYLAVLVSALLAVAGLSMPAHAVGEPVMVCHATGGTKYVINNPDRDSVVQPSGHAGHSDDIIPPFHYTVQLGKGKDAVFEERYFPGQNFGPEGQATWANGCVVPPSPPAHDECPDLAGDQPAGTQCAKPADVVKTSSSEGAPDCVTGTVPVTTTTTTTTYSFNSSSNTWVPSTTSSDKTVDRPATDAECPPPVPHDECSELPGDQPAGFECTKADKVVVGEPVEGDPDCSTGQVPVSTTTSTTTYTFDQASQSWLASMKQTADTTYRAASAEECPPAVPHDECAELPGDQPVGFECEAPAPQVDKSSVKGEVDCETGTVPVTRTIVTTPYVFDASVGRWVLGAPESSTRYTLREAKASDCPDEPVDTGNGGDGTVGGEEKPADGNEPDAVGTPAVVAGAEDKTGSGVAASGVNRPAAVVLPQTGGTSDLGLLAGLALALVMAGGLIISTQRSVLRLRE